MIAAWFVVIEYRLHIGGNLGRAKGAVRRGNPQSLVALPVPARAAVIAPHDHQIARGNLRIMRAKMRAKTARKAAKEAIQMANRAEAEAWSIRMEGYGGPAQPSPTIGQCLNGG